MPNFMAGVSLPEQVDVNLYLILVGSIARAKGLTRDDPTRCTGGSLDRPFSHPGAMHRVTGWMLIRADSVGRSPRNT
jgi:hypothetical protein